MRAFNGIEHARTPRAEFFEGGGGGGMRPHVGVHRGGDPPRFGFQFPREPERADDVVGQAGGEAIDGVGGGGAEQSEVGVAGEGDVVERATGFEEIGEHRAAAQAFKGGGADEAQRGGRGDRLHGDAGLSEPRNGGAGFVAGDGAAEEEEDVTARHCR